MKQAIVGYHKDEENDWLAELRCGHVQHVRDNLKTKELCLLAVKNDKTAIKYVKKEFKAECLNAIYYVSE